MASRYYVVVTVAISVMLSSPAEATCRAVTEDPIIRIDRNALADLKQIGITQDKIFDALKEVSVPETNGCWGGATGNFDGQIISVGTLQWNCGQNFASTSPAQLPE